MRRAIDTIDNQLIGDQTVSVRFFRCNLQTLELFTISNMEILIIIYPKHWYSVSIL